MTQIMIALDDELMGQLQKSAEQSQQSVEDAARRGLTAYFAREAEFRKITDYLLHKNAELYRRLAQ